ncbi:MAG TPA: hypothetical protein VGD90_13120 [Sphingobacteriaceae bacterium]
MAIQNDRVERSTPQSINREIEQQLHDNIRFYAGQGKSAISQRIEELEKEWYMDRTLITNASALAGMGLILGATVSKRWFILPGVVMTFLLQHGLQGWCPPLPLFRKLGIRSFKEIDRERYALKILRGDFGEEIRSRYRHSPEQLYLDISK